MELEKYRQQKLTELTTLETEYQNALRDIGLGHEGVAEEVLSKRLVDKAVLPKRRFFDEEVLPKRCCRRGVLPKRLVPQRSCR